jgi:hypothetical protein
VVDDNLGKCLGHYKVFLDIALDKTLIRGEQQNASKNQVWI